MALRAGSAVKSCSVVQASNQDLTDPGQFI